MKEAAIFRDNTLKVIKEKDNNDIKHNLNLEGKEILEQEIINKV